MLGVGRGEQQGGLELPGCKRGGGCAGDLSSQWVRAGNILGPWRQLLLETFHFSGISLI